MSAIDDGYVQCSECGHAIEGHNTLGCYEVDECSCREAWTYDQIRWARQNNGLPGEVDV
jgi:hypothetical protein